MINPDDFEVLTLLDDECQKYLFNDDKIFRMEHISINGLNYLEAINQTFWFDMNGLHYTTFEDDVIEEVDDLLDGNDTEHYVDYYKCIHDQLFLVKQELCRDDKSRRAIIHFTQLPQPSCLISIQFLIRKGKLNIIANFRSWELEHYAIRDLYLLYRLARIMSEELNYIMLDKIYINAASAHIIV